MLVGDVADVVEGPEVKRGDSSAFVRESDGEFSGGSAVVLTVTKQPKADTRQVTADVARALDELRASLPDDVRLHAGLYQQRDFIDRAIDNVIGALRDGGVLVVVILFLFLLNFRTTFITLTAIPLSIVITGIVFTMFGLSINTMTLGGLAIAIGELVDDAIVDVENIFRRLRENDAAGKPRPPILVVFQASAEIRNSIVFGTMIVVLAFTPVFALGGMEGRLFAPVGVAYIVSLLASLLVSLTVTPVLSYWLLACRNVWPWVAAALAAGGSAVLMIWCMPYVLSQLGLHAASYRWSSLPVEVPLVAAIPVAGVAWAVMIWADRWAERERDGLLLRGLKAIAGRVIAQSTHAPVPILVTVTLAVSVAVVGLLRLESDFLPPFDEGAVQINVLLPPGTSLETSKGVARMVEKRLEQLDDVQALVLKSGRAELDEHAVTVNVTEVIALIDPQSEKSREETLEEIREAMADIPGIVTGVEQPLAHLVSHMLSGVQAQVAIKLYGDDLEIMRRAAENIETAIAGVPGVTDLQVEPQVEIPQLRIEIDGAQLKKYGLRRAQINEFVETAMNGTVVSEVLQGQRTFDLMVRLEEPVREDLEAVKRLSIDLPDGGTTTLGSLADVYETTGPNTINREDARRRIVIQCNTSGRGLVDVVRDIKARLAPIERSLPTGYFVEYGGQFESQQSASREIAVYFALAAGGMFLVLNAMFRSANLALQVMVALPMAFIGSVAALYLTGQTLTVAAMVGFISLCGIASRNGILLINHYLHLVEHEGETWSREMIVRAGRERVAPVVMTALTSGIGLVPLAMASGEAGKEILYPVATVIIGGLITSTALEFLVRPALFWQFGLGAARRIVEQGRSEVALEEDTP